MKYFLIILREISIQLFWGFMLGTIILIIGWLLGYKEITQLSGILFKVAAVMLLLGPIVFRPKGLSYPSHLRSSGRFLVPSAIAEPPDDTTLLGLSDEEQKKHLSMEGFVVLIKLFGIGITMFFYSIIFHFTMIGRL